jgi:hypothetical protein
METSNSLKWEGLSGSDLRNWNAFAPLGENNSRLLNSMKRRKKKNRGGHAKPFGGKKAMAAVWQTLEFRDLVVLVEGWELIKLGQARVIASPKEKDFLQDWIKGQPQAAQIYFEWLDSIIPAARSEIAAWLDPENPPSITGITEAVVPSASRLPSTVFLVVVRLWERFLAAGELGGIDGRCRWLSERTREEQDLVTRLSRRITLPTA